MSVSFGHRSLIFMKPIFIHLHLFYKELWTELKACILNIRDYPFVLFVTIAEHDAEIEKDIKKTFPEAKILLVDNVGYDIYPFLMVLSLNDLKDYSYVIKLHSKRNVKNINPFVWYAGAKWRENLLAFIKNKSSFSRTLTVMEKNPSIGMHGANVCITNRFTDEKRAQRETFSFIENKGFKKCNYDFVAGSMFIAKASVLQPLKQLNLTADDFVTPDSSHESCQLAHILERFCGYIVKNQGYKIADCTVSPFFSGFIFFFLCLRKILMSFLFSVRITNSNKLNVKICKIPVINKKLKK